MIVEKRDPLDFYAESRDNPLLFVEGVLGVTPEKWQREALKGIGANPRAAVRSGHGVGKTALISWIILWWLCTRKPCKVLLTANSESQLKDVTWPEIAIWSRFLPDEIRSQYEFESERIYLKAQPESCFASRRTASTERPESLQGFHSEYSLVVVEEASGIADVLFQVMLGALSTEHSKLVMVGNPTRNSGYFFDAFHLLADRFFKMRVSSEDVPRARAHIEDVVARFGKDSNTYRVRVEGEFPTADDETVIPLFLCKDAVSRDVAPSKNQRVIWGVDVARFGDDRSALAKRMGNTLLEPVQTWKNLDTMQLSGAIVDAYKQEKERKPHLILVDVIGIGSGVVDRLREQGLPVRGINVGESPSSKERYVRLRDELWFVAREWLSDKGCKLPNDEDLIQELTTPLYGYASNGKLLVESKADLKKRGQRSPDLADAFILTFANGNDNFTQQWTQPSTRWVV